MCLPTNARGYLDEQFCLIEDLQDEASPNFTEEVVSLFFKDSTRLMTNIEQAMEKNPRDFNRWDANMQQLKGSCSSIGASRMKNECTLFRNCCGDENAEGCMRSFQKLKREHGALRQKLESYFQLLRQAGPADTASARGKFVVYPPKSGRSRQALELPIGVLRRYGLTDVLCHLPFCQVSMLCDMRLLKTVGNRGDRLDVAMGAIKT
ncbi:hypothetical protein U9M48_044634 [Paspalum notatum var. saurae]|uniref:Histidine-containing phosphotransfer protein n=1 Tax=Paspalum notatum var. saurae TaxID=547442 RepID=A0AAQ3XIR7_PASNO